MLLQKALLTLAAISSAVAAPILDKRTEPTRGVSLGGWLVLEPWITPSVFHNYGGSVVDEYTLCQKDPDNAKAVLQAHWSSWVTLSDFQRIANSGKGINMVRIPIGYWAFQRYGQDPYIEGAKDYLWQAVGWASQTGLQVWIDLHGAPLSQNGFDNSGQRTGNIEFGSGDTVSWMARVTAQVASEFGSNPAVAGIELVNEPLMGSMPGGRGNLQNYYNQAYGAVRGSYAGGIVISDGFAEPSSWDGDMMDTIVDHHEYQVFSNADVAMSYQEHVDAAYSRAATWGNSDKTLICGEWTAAMTDCAAALVSHLPAMSCPFPFY